MSRKQAVEDLAMALVGEDTPQVRARVKVAMQFRVDKAWDQGLRFVCRHCRHAHVFTMAEAWEPMKVENWQVAHLRAKHPRIAL